jgi:hypothetical protein
MSIIDNMYTYILCIQYSLIYHAPWEEGQPNVTNRTLSSKKNRAIADDGGRGSNITKIRVTLFVKSPYSHETTIY